MSYFGIEPGSMTPDEMRGPDGPIPTAPSEDDLEPFERGPCSVCHGKGGDAAGPCEDCHATGYHWTRDELANYDPSEDELTLYNGPQ